jgi:hypothetical protein
MSGRTRLVSLLVGMWVLGCSSFSVPTLTQPRFTPPTGQPLASTGDRVGSVVVTVDESLTAEQKELLARCQVVEHLTSQLSELTGTGGNVTLNVKITKFRLRSTFVAVTLSFFAGLDALDVAVSAETDDNLLREFEKKIASNGTNGTQGGRQARADFMVQIIAKAVAVAL